MPSASAFLGDRKIEVIGKVWWMHAESRGTKAERLISILDRLGVTATLWCQLITQFDPWFGHVVGSADRLTERAVRAGRRWVAGRSRCAEAFG